MPGELVKNINYIPTLPSVLFQLVAHLNDPNSGAGDLEKIIIHDQALSSKVLAVANSSYYGFRHKILTVRRAVVALGYEEIRNICLGATLVGYLHPSTFRDKQAAELLWLHSLCVAEAARIIAVKSQALKPDPAFCAGLLHDLGKVVLSAFFTEKLEALREIMDREGMPYRQAEQAVEADHCRYGLALADLWDLPPELGQAMGHHHEITDALEHYPFAAVTHLADFISRQLHLGHSGNPDPPEMEQAVLARLGLSNEAFQECRQELNARRSSVTDLWRMLLNA